MFTDPISRSNFLCTLVIIELTNSSRAEEAREAFGGDEDHPAIKYLYNTVQEFYMGGKIDAINRLEHYDYVALRCKLRIMMLDLQSLT